MVTDYQMALLKAEAEQLDPRQIEEKLLRASLRAESAMCQINEIFSRLRSHPQIGRMAVTIPAYQLEDLIRSYLVATGTVLRNLSELALLGELKETDLMGGLEYLMRRHLQELEKNYAKQGGDPSCMT